MTSLSPGMCRPAKRFRASFSGLSQQRLEMGPLTGFIAGSSCEDFSKYGKRKGLQGPRMKSYLCMCTIILDQLPSFLLFENVEACPISLLTDHLGEHYDFMSGVFSPVQLGWPVRRPRRYSFGWLRRDFRFLGSWDDLVATMLNTGLPELTADDFLIAPQAERMDYMKRLAQIQGNFFAEDRCFVSLEWVLCVCVCEVVANMSNGCVVTALQVCF